MHVISASLDPTCRRASVHGDSARAKLVKPFHTPLTSAPKAAAFRFCVASMDPAVPALEARH